MFSLKNVDNVPIQNSDICSIALSEELYNYLIHHIYIYGIYYTYIYMYVVDLSSTEPDWMELYIPYKTSIYILHDDYTI